MKSIKNKKVLMLCYYFPPYMDVGSLRSRKFAQYLPRYGWRCEVITAHRGKNYATMFPESVNIHYTLRFDFDNILAAGVKLVPFIKRTLLKIMTAIEFKKGGITRDPTIISIGGLGISTRILPWLLLPDAQFLWIVWAMPKALWFARRCKVIYSSSAPVSAHVLALIVHKITKKPWVADFRDPWTLDTDWIPPTRFHRWLGERLERACLKNARYVVNVTKPITENLKQKYPKYDNKCMTIHNGYDEIDLAGFRDRKPTSEYMLFTSLGSLYGGRDPTTFIEASKELLDEGVISRCSFRVLIIGALNKSLEMMATKHHLEDVVKILPRMPQHEAFEYLAKSHVAVLFGSDMEKTCMTSKVYEYAGMGKLIFALVPDGPVKDFVEKCSGLVAAPNDKTQIKDALRALFKMCREGKTTNLNISEITLQYERSVLTSQMAELLNKSCAT